MFYGFFTNRWILMGIGFLIIFAGLCYLFYQYTTAPYRKDAALHQEKIHQYKKQRTGTIGDPSASEQVTDSNVGGIEQNAKEPIKDTSSTIDKTESTKTQAYAAPQTTETVDTENTPVSPFGFGPYPELGDYPHEVIWTTNTPSLELLTRVLIKLWNEGERNFIGGSISNGKVYPHYNDVVYYKFTPIRDKEGNIRGGTTETLSGPHVRYNKSDLTNPPPGLRVLDLDSSGIDPYKYLNIR